MSVFSRASEYQLEVLSFSIELQVLHTQGKVLARLPVYEVKSLFSIKKRNA